MLSDMLLAPVFGYGFTSILELMKKWTADENKLFIELYPNTRNVDLAQMFETTYSSVNTKAYKLKLFKTEEFRRIHSAKGQYVKGQMPPNKGKKMSAETYEKCRQTMFKKNNLPHNTRADGDISIRADNRKKLYRFIRVSLSIWTPYSKFIWEQQNGKVPKGMCLWHSDGDTLNDNIDNLELITRRENRIRNSGSTTLTDHYVALTIYTKKHPELKEVINAMPELIELKRNQLKLRRQCQQLQG